jgi:hypothetical protein
MQQLLMKIISEQHVTKVHLKRVYVNEISFDFFSQIFADHCAVREC